MLASQNHLVVQYDATLSSTGAEIPISPLTPVGAAAWITFRPKAPGPIEGDFGSPISHNREVKLQREVLALRRDEFDLEHRAAGANVRAA